MNVEFYERTGNSGVPDSYLMRYKFCPLEWGIFNCVLGLYSQWLCVKRGSDWEQAAKLAETIVELPEKKGDKC